MLISAGPDQRYSKILHAFAHFRIAIKPPRDPVVTQDPEQVTYTSFHREMDRNAQLVYPTREHYKSTAGTLHLINFPTHQHDAATIHSSLSSLM